MGYATVADVRDEVVQTTTTEYFTLASTAGSIATPSQITLKDSTTKALQSVSRNGTVMVSGYALVKPNKVTFSPSLTDGDIIELVRDTELTDTQIQRYIDYITNVINSTLQVTYKVPFATAPNSPPLINTLCINLTAAIIRKRLFDSTGKEGDRRGQMMWTEWMLFMDNVRKRILLLTDINGVSIEPTSHGMLIDPGNQTTIFDLNEPFDILYLSPRTGVVPDRFMGFQSTH